MTKKIAVAFLLLASISAFWINSFKLCVQLPNSENTVTFIHKITGFGSSDVVAFKVLGVVCFVFFMILPLVKNFIANLGLVFSFWVIELIFLIGWVNTVSFIQLINDSLVHCPTWPIYGFVIGHAGFLVGSIIYLISAFKTARK